MKRQEVEVTMYLQYEPGTAQDAHAHAVLEKAHDTLNKHRIISDRPGRWFTAPSPASPGPDPRDAMIDALSTGLAECITDHSALSYVLPTENARARLDAITEAAYRALRRAAEIRLTAHQEARRDA